MIDEQCLDMTRLAFLIISLSVNAIISYYTAKRIDISWISYTLYFLESLSLIYIILTYSRRGYVDYQSDEFKSGVISKTCRYCRHCNGYKPPRSHHCSTCNRCIKKMDHHCMWLGVCVNFDNHGDFIRFLFFTFFSMFTTIMACCYYIYKFPVHTYSILMRVSLAWNIIYSTGVAFICAAMLKIQIMLISKNLTFIEDQYFYASSQRSVYDRGLWENWKEVMGSCKTLWLCDIKSSGEYNTLYNIDDTEDIDFL